MALNKSIMKLALLPCFWLAGIVTIFSQTPCSIAKCGSAAKSSQKVMAITDNGNQNLEAVIHGNLAIIGGDIAVKVDQAKVVNVNGQLTFNRLRPQLWDNGVIPYTISPGHRAKQYIEKAIDYLNSLKKETHVCMRPIEQDDKDFLVFIEDSKDFSWSHVGKTGGPQNIAINVNNYAIDKLKIHTVLHEIGHAIGLIHEHQLPWRDNHIRVNENMCEEFEKWFEKDNSLLYPEYEPNYDLFSIMHYAPCSVSKNGNYVFSKFDPQTSTLTNCPPGVGTTSALTTLDKKKIRILYPFRSQCEVQSATLFLFDMSGSMSLMGSSGATKIYEAKVAAMKTINNIAAALKTTQAVGITTFSGECVAEPINPINIPFTTNLREAYYWVKGLPDPNGGTPLPQAISSSEKKFISYLNDHDLKQGKLIILSDGESTCGPIRPEDVYAFGYAGQASRTYNVNPLNASSAVAVKYFTIGFNIAPGSSAERDLQYLAQISGGKYLNAQNQFELTRAFQKFSRVYVPKPNPSLNNLPSTARDLFREGVQAIESELFSNALQQYNQFVIQQPQDCHGFYNLALMCEANELYKAAVKNYEAYLSLCNEAKDRDNILQQIDTLKQDYTNFLEFNRKIIASDLAYLELHFKKIQNGESVALAQEFIGFIKEKWAYYQRLPEILEIDTRAFKLNTQAVFRGIQDCAAAIKRNPQTWDRDATPALSMTYINLERLLDSF